MIDLRPDLLVIVQEILQRLVPAFEVRAFGSRQKWTAKDTSDLDLVVVGSQRLPLKTMASLKEAFEESILPMRVDVLDWNAISEEFRRVIETGFEVIHGVTASTLARAYPPLDAGATATLFLGETRSATEWPTVQLCDLSETVTKGTTPTTIGGAFCSTGISFVKVESISDDGRFISEKFAHIDSKTNSLLTRSIIRENDILFTIAGTIGRVAIVGNDILPANTNQAVAIIRPQESKVNPRFLYYSLRKKDIILGAQSRTVQSVQANFSLGELKKIPIPVPPLHIQNYIAHILGTLDNRIELCRRMNATLEAMVRSLFKDWFIDFGPVRSKMESREPPGLSPKIADLFPSKLVDSDKGEIPEGWSIETLLEISELNSESWSKKKPPTHIDYLDLSNVKWGEVENVTRHIWAEAPSRAQRVIRPGDTIVGTVRPGNGSYCLVGANGLTASTGFAVLRPKQSFLREFLYLAATSPENIERLTNLADGGAYPAVRPEVVAATEVPLPHQALFMAFSAATSIHLNQIQINYETIRTLSTLRDTLLPKLLSGELSIPEAMLQVETMG